MPPRKNRPVLFEVVARSQRPRKRTPVQPSQPTPAEEAPSPPPRVEHKAPARPAPRPTPAPSTGGAPQAFRMEGGRLYLTLGTPQLIVLALLVIVVLVATFQAGVRSAQPVTPTEDGVSDLLTEGAPAGPPPVEAPDVRPEHRARRRDVATPIGSPERDEGARTPPPPEPEPEPGPRFSFVPGYHYVVVQYFPGSKRSHANKAAEFLAENGVEAVVREGRGDWLLIATDAFQTPDAADGLIRRIKQIGDEYMKAGGGYDFAGAAARRF